MSTKKLIQKFKKEKLPAITAWSELDASIDVKLRRQEWESFLIEENSSGIAFPRELEKAMPSFNSLSKYVKEMVKVEMMDPDNYREFLKVG